MLLARLLEAKPKVLILDEPTRGVDIGAKSEIYRLIDALAHEGVGVIVISSDLPEVAGICDRVLVIRNGLVAGEVMDAALSPAAVEVLDRLVFEGYKGWTDSISARMVTSYLSDLDDTGAYDRDIVLAYARQTKHEGAIERLQKLIDAFEASKRSPSVAASREFRTTRRW